MAEETGAVAAEFTVVLPTVLAILLFSLSAVAMQVQAATLEQDAAIAARALGRGESSAIVSTWLNKHLQNFKLSTTVADGIFCANLRQRLKVGAALPGFDLSEQSCVWVGQAVPQ